MVSMLALMTGCATSYRVHVSTFSELDKPIPRDSGIYVERPTESQNPIFDRQIMEKIGRLLHERGYGVASDPTTAAYVLHFTVGIESHRIWRSEWVGPAWGFGYRWAEPSWTLPYPETVHEPWMVIKLSQAKAPDKGEPQVVWFGKAVSSRSSGDIRDAIDYLLVATLDFFGADTKNTILLTLDKDDPRVLSLRRP